jgi:hypothetical protein
LIELSLPFQRLHHFAQAIALGTKFIAGAVVGDLPLGAGWFGAHGHLLSGYGITSASFLPGHSERSQ